MVVAGLCKSMIVYVQCMLHLGAHSGWRVAQLESLLLDHSTVQPNDVQLAMQWATALGSG